VEVREARMNGLARVFPTELGAGMMSELHSACEYHSAAMRHQWLMPEFFYQFSIRNFWIDDSFQHSRH
jgi:hypothetical protein